MMKGDVTITRRKLSIECIINDCISFIIITREKLSLFLERV